MIILLSKTLVLSITMSSTSSCTIFYLLCLLMELSLEPHVLFMVFRVSKTDWWLMTLILASLTPDSNS